MAAVVFDLGNVLVEWKPLQVLSERFIEETQFFVWNTDLDLGEPFDDVVERMRSEYPDFAEEFDAFRDRWPETLGEVLHDVVAIAHELRERGVAIYVLSNSSTETLPRSDAANEVLAKFDGVLLSGEIGLVKPDRAIFDEAVRRWKLDPAQSWFVDDSAVNVEGARAAGWNALHFTDAVQLRTDLLDASLL